MKKLIILAVSLLSISSFTYANETNKEHSVVILSRVAFDNVVINGDMDVVLTEGSFVQVEVKGEEKAVHAVRYFVKKGTLYLTAQKAMFNAKPTVYIQVSRLHYLEVNGKSKVSSNGTLNSNKLKVMINGDVQFNVRNYGEILIESDSDIDLQFEKWIEKRIVTAGNPNTGTIAEADSSMDSQFMKSFSIIDECKQTLIQ